MSTSYGPVARYRCFCDCRQTGCPGHTMQLVYHNTSDVMRFVQDGDERDPEHEDPSRWEAKMRAWERWNSGGRSDADSEDAE